MAQSELALWRFSLIAPLLHRAPKEARSKALAEWTDLQARAANNAEKKEVAAEKK